MLRIFPYIVVGILVFLTLFYLAAYQPELVNAILIRIDVFGVTQVAEEEQKRMAAINELSIPYEEKQVLRNRTVFLGASSGMVKLALGEPKKIVQGMHEGNPVTYYVYYLPNEKRPTILMLTHDDKLFKAYKGSALDVGN